MIAVSDAWKGIQYRFLLPETFVEIDCTITDAAVQESASIRGENEAVFSNTASTLYDTAKTVKYATNELNLWALDGTISIAPDSAPYADTGYASETDTGSVVVTLPAVHTGATSGVTGATGAIGITTFLLSVGAVYIGKAMGDKLADKASFAGGVVLVCIGLKLLFDGLL